MDVSLGTTVMWMCLSGRQPGRYGIVSCCLTLFRFSSVLLQMKNVGGSWAQALSMRWKSGPACGGKWMHECRHTRILWGGKVIIHCPNPISNSINLSQFINWSSTFLSNYKKEVVHLKDAPEIHKNTMHLISLKMHQVYNYPSCPKNLGPFCLGIAGMWSPAEVVKIHK